MQLPLLVTGGSGICRVERRCSSDYPHATRSIPLENGHLACLPAVLCGLFASSFARYTPDTRLSTSSRIRLGDQSFDRVAFRAWSLTNPRPCLFEIAPYRACTRSSRRSMKRRTKSRKGGEKDRSILLRSSFSFFPFFLFFLQFELKRVTRSCDKVDCRLAREKKREERGRNRLISVPTSWSEWRRVREEGGGGETSTGKNS